MKNSSLSRPDKCELSPITFSCPRCQRQIDALEGRDRASCEHCGEVTKVPAVWDVDTITLAELDALRAKTTGK